MKKIIITDVALCLATFTQAAVANWKTTAVNIYDGTGSTTSKYTGSAYIFDAGIKTQSALFESIMSGTSVDASTAGYVATATVANGGISAYTFEYGEQSVSSSDLKSYSYYFVLLDDSKVYFSNTKTASANANATAKSLPFGSQTNSSIAPTAAGYVGEGKWSSVPEPTSAMLLMLGLCGLALKRKNA